MQEAAEEPGEELSPPSEVASIKNVAMPSVSEESCPNNEENSLKEPCQDQNNDGDNVSQGSASLESIRRPRSNSKKRNYRQTTGIDGSSISDDDDQEPKCTSSRLDFPDTQLSGTSSGEMSTMPVEQKCDPSVAPPEDEDMSRDSTTYADMPMLENSPSPLPNMPGFLSSDDSNFDPGEPRLAFYPGGVELEDSNMSSSLSSSLDFMQDEDELEEDDDSSESSDDSLEDLQDIPVATTTCNSNSRSEQLPENPAKMQQQSNQKDKKKNQPLPKVLLKPKPKCTWNAPREVFNREMGFRTRIQAQSAQVFRSKFYGSLFSAERLELMSKLDGHDGCVNCLNFNYAGTKLASGSDDLEIKIWNYGLGKLLTSFNSKHRSNVFQAKFMPLVGTDNIIVSCARDSQVRLTELDCTGSVVSSRKISQHRGPVHKLAIHPGTPHVVLSCGEDGVVYSCDIREDKSQKILSLVENGRKLSLYSIHSNPLVSHEFCISGRDEYVRIYDSRKLSRSEIPSANNNENSRAGGDSGGGASSSSSANSSTNPLKRFCPHHLQGHKSKPHITAAVYNYSGSEIVASYNDENIYLFDASHSDFADYVKVYEGHLNSATVKGVNFFGDKSQFIVSGSDCSHVFIWDKETESIVNFLRGDEKGVVNCLEPHPTAPILATSGLDDDIKIWIPSNENPPKMGELASTVKKNIKKRDEEMDARPNALDGQIMWQLIHHLHREQRRNRRTQGQESESDSSSEDDEEEGAGSAAPRDCSIV